jgi:hypothetical protein
MRAAEQQRPDVDSGDRDAYFLVTPLEWGATVVDGVLFRDGLQVGRLLGRATGQSE